ncbi:glutamyl-tRNA(Gln) amidotransferase subunit C [Metamycoplasma alkalescens]|uniref:Glutamyl-tRNA (Gln) amidotransferase subunit C n=2 Tax=Metamycoplasma alkalescens TaxID=45363 RepID=N9UAM9_9BACT|nr:glutamyl-tRNA(Gln) amidotransferase subunit C [Metamycoplasma alkalescens]ENY53736.1 Glutamyl-tRNA (Gln) amidotransferase subunit C [Metamycoplasma alkalescens 14918]PYF42540.1 aspartyl-tRNA(Asn)/glutamyl-tRNA(Gln) amidotransferase subunit C [Metamycoplasma alkalescens]SYV90717.1 glutamyl-tRNA(gln)amidotransferase subunit C [Metamycoplasma alkalescens]
MKEAKIKELANNLLLEPSEEIIKLTQDLLATIDKELLELESINLDDIKPISHLDEIGIEFDDLREDIVDERKKISKEDILKNAAKSNDQFVIMKRVVNEQ